MRPAATLMQLALAVSSVAPVVSAWPNWLPEREALIVRADSSDDSTRMATLIHGYEVLNRTVANTSLSLPYPSSDRLISNRCQGDRKGYGQSKHGHAYWEIRIR